MPDHPYLFEANDANFETVLNRHPGQTVVVDFWATWCAPCRLLGPILENVVESYAGRAVLVKVNADENPSLCEQFDVQGIPAVKIFQNGDLVDEFVGALPELEVRRILGRTIATEADDWAARGDTSLEQEKRDEAERLYREALQRDEKHSGALVGLAKIALHQRQLNSAQQYLHRVEVGSAAFEEAQRQLNLLDLMSMADPFGGRETCEKRLQENQDDLDARYGLGCCLAVDGQYPEALETLLSVVKKDKKYQDGAAKIAMVKIFSLIGQRHPLSDEYRDKLEWILY